MTFRQAAWTFTITFCILAFLYYCLGIDIFWWRH